MDQKTEIMVALGVAIGVNCIPCFDHLYSKSQEIKVEEAEVKAMTFAHLGHNIFEFCSKFFLFDKQVPHS